MGVTAHSVRLLVAAHRRGARFDSTLTLGRLDLYPARSEIEAELSARGCPPAGPMPAAESDWRYAEPFFALLGAKQVDSLDASDFEGASLVHDLNRPLPPELGDRYDVVYDGGTLEHVFDVPEALRSCMRLVRVGGRVFLDMPGNGSMGHGFYQFSPELFFQVFSKDNGFELERITAYETFPQGRYYRLTDPRAVGRRGEIRTKHSLQLFVEARKIARVEPPLATPPQQAFFASQWGDERGEADAATERKRARRRRLHARLGRWLGGHPALLHWVGARVEDLHVRRKGLEGRREFCRRVDVGEP